MDEYLKLKAKVAEYIDSLELPEGARLPTEAQFCRSFHVNHYQIRKVLAELGQARNWVKIQGSGTYIPGGEQRRPREKVIAVVCAYSRDLASQISEAHAFALQQNYQLLLFGLDHKGTESETECLKHLLSRRLFALILDPHPGNAATSEGLINQFIAAGTKVVLLNGSPRFHERFTVYNFHYYRAGYMALVHLMRFGVNKVVHLSRLNSIAWQHQEFAQGVQEAARDFSIPVEKYPAEFYLDVNTFDWRWHPDGFEVPLEENTGYADDNNPYEATYVQRCLENKHFLNTPVVSVFQAPVAVPCAMLYFDNGARLKWIVEALLAKQPLPTQANFIPCLMTGAKQLSYLPIE